MGNLISNVGRRDISDVRLDEGTTRVLTENQVRDLLKKEGVPVVHTRSTNYRTLDTDQLTSFLREDGTNVFPYQKEHLDCDDFSRILLGRVYEQLVKEGTFQENTPAIGEILGHISKNGTEDTIAHSMIVVLVLQDDEPVVRLIEPQDDTWYEPNTASDYWKVRI